MARFLGVGIATLDIINVVDTYPNEDDEVRATTQYKTRGGNATNTASVLAQFGHDVCWAGTSCCEPDAALILADLKRNNIDTSFVKTLDAGKVPTSYITLSRASGSRTIVHYRDLPEYSFTDFQTIPLAQFNWIHFEGRAIDDTRRMLLYVRDVASHVITSVEIEKPRPEIESLIPLANILFFSRQYALTKGHSDPTSFLYFMASLNPTADLICGWGDGGAFGRSAITQNVFHVPAHRQPKVVDTVGAGDTLIAGVIHGLMCGKCLFEALQLGVRLAGIKCGQIGYDNLVGQLHT